MTFLLIQSLISENLEYCLSDWLTVWINFSWISTLTPRITLNKIQVIESLLYSEGLSFHKNYHEFISSTNDLNDTPILIAYYLYGVLEYRRINDITTNNFLLLYGIKNIDSILLWVFLIIKQMFLTYFNIICDLSWLNANFLGVCMYWSSSSCSHENYKLVPKVRHVCR